MMLVIWNIGVKSWQGDKSSCAFANSDWPYQWIIQRKEDDDVYDDISYMINDHWSLKANTRDEANSISCEFTKRKSGEHTGEIHKVSFLNWCIGVATPTSDGLDGLMDFKSLMEPLTEMEPHWHALIYTVGALVVLLVFMISIKTKQAKYVFFFFRKEGLTVPRTASLAISPTYCGNNRSVILWNIQTLDL